MVSQLPKDQYRTPLQLFESFDSRFHFTLDGAASSHDTLCSRWWGPQGEKNDFFDTDSADFVDETIWLNPPYSMIREFCAHVRKVARPDRRICWLLPMFSDRKWFHEHFWNPLTGMWQPGVRPYFIEGRIRFLNPDGSLPKDGPRFPSIILTENLPW